MKWKERLLPHVSFESIIRRLVASWFWGAFVLLLMQGTSFASTDFLKDMTWGLPITLFAVCFVLFSALAILVPRVRTDSFLMLSGLVFLSAAWMSSKQMSDEVRWLFCLAVLGVFALVLWDFVSQNDDLLTAVSLPHSFSFWVAVAVGVLMALVIGVVTCLRYMTFNSPTYDFGIFAQMYHNMAELVGPITTCERNEVLSHFAIHLSPIYYILLPFYWIFPSPLTLQIGQAVAVASGIIPMYLLMKKWELSPKARAVFSVLYLLIPATSKGCFFDIHENCFLFPLLLWLFWAFETEKLPLVALFTVMTCLVKEDSAVYVTIFALYALFSAKTAKRRWTALIMAGYEVLYFGFAVWYIDTFGKGIMSGRYDNLSADGSLVGVIFAAFANPGFFIQQILCCGWESVQYILALLLPLGFLPLATGKRARWILLIPMLLNLLTDYPYQLELRFQYHFGITAFLLYAALMNFSDLKGKAGKYLISLALAGSFLFYSYYIIPDLGSRVQAYRQNHESLHEMEAVMQVIPEDASVNASTFLVPHLANRFYLYDIDYHPEADTDLVILDVRGGGKEREKRMEETCKREGYILLAETPTLKIYVSPAWEGDAAALLSSVRSVTTVRHADEMISYAPSAEVQAIMALLPEGASINTSAVLVSHCKDRFEAYSITRHSETDTDFVLLLGLSGTMEIKMLDDCTAAGYRYYETREVVLLVSPDWEGDMDALTKAMLPYLMI